MIDLNQPHGTGNVWQKDRGHRLVFAPTGVAGRALQELLIDPDIRADQVVILDSGQSFRQLAEQIDERFHA